MNNEHFVTKNLNIDLHIHSYSSFYKDGNIVANSNIDNTSCLIKKLEENNINMFSITDHNRFDYELYKKLKKEISNSNIIYNILPGIEFDVQLEEKYPKCHIVTIFDDSDENKLKMISKTIKDYRELSAEEFYTTDEFEILLKKLNIKTILIVHQKQALDNKTGKTDSLSASCEDPSYFLKIGYVDSLEYGSTRTEGILKDSLNSLNISFPMITGSDCHQWEAYPFRDSKSPKIKRNFSSFKCLPTFKGLLMAISSFDSRANRTNNVNEHYIKSITVKGTEYPLANGINAIIGDNGSGKTLLLNLLCNGKLKVYDSLVEKNKITFQYNNTTFQKQAINYIPQGDIVKKVREGNLFDKNSDYYDNITTKNLFSENIFTYFNDLSNFINKNIKVNDELLKLKNYNIKIQTVKRNFYLPVLNANITLEDIDNDKKRIESLKEKIALLKNEFDTNTNYYQNLNVDKEFKNVIDSLNVIFNKINMNYNEKRKRNEVKGIITLKFKNYSTSLSTRRTTEETINKNLLDSYNKFKNNIISYIKLQKVENKFPTFPKKIEGSTSKQVNDYYFIKTASYHNVDLKNEFYLYCFNSKYASEDKIKEINTIDDFKEALKGCTSLQEIDKYKSTKIQGFIDEWSKEKTFITDVSSKNSVGNTPGEISLVYYKFLIQEKEDDFCVLAIDQPEDDINPKRIKDFLLNYLSSIRDKKQILIVTHNPLLVVNLDVDNVIFLNKNNNDISIKYGCLEYEKDYNILDLIKDNLDGGYKAIEGRLKKYDRDEN